MSLHDSHKSFRPVAVLTLRWNYAKSIRDGGTEPFLYHAWNIALHAAATALFTVSRGLALCAPVVVVVVVVVTAAAPAAKVRGEGLLFEQPGGRDGGVALGGAALRGAPGAHRARGLPRGPRRRALRRPGPRGAALLRRHAAPQRRSPPETPQKSSSGGAGRDHGDHGDHGAVAAVAAVVASGGARGLLPPRLPRVLLQGARRDGLRSLRRPRDHRVHRCVAHEAAAVAPCVSFPLGAAAAGRRFWG